MTRTEEKANDEITAAKESADNKKKEEDNNAGVKSLEAEAQAATLKPDEEARKLAEEDETKHNNEVNEKQAQIDAPK